MTNRTRLDFKCVPSATEKKSICFNLTLRKKGGLRFWELVLNRRRVILTSRIVADSSRKFNHMTHRTVEQSSLHNLAKEIRTLFLFLAFLLLHFIAGESLIETLSFFKTDSQKLYVNKKTSVTSSAKDIGRAR